MCLSMCLSIANLNALKAYFGCFTSCEKHHIGQNEKTTFCHIDQDKASKQVSFSNMKFIMKGVRWHRKNFKNRQFGCLNLQLKSKGLYAIRFQRIRIRKIAFVKIIAHHLLCWLIICYKFQFYPAHKYAILNKQQKYEILTLKGN